MKEELLPPFGQYIRAPKAAPTTLFVMAATTVQD